MVHPLAAQTDKTNTNTIIVGEIDAGRDWGQEEKGTTEDEMAGWYH